MRPAEKDVLGLPFIVGQSESRIFKQFDIAADESRLARAALTLLAPVHQGNALAKRRIEHGLALLDLHLEADRFQAHRMNHRVRHELPTSQRHELPALRRASTGYRFLRTGAATCGPLIDSLV